MLTAGDEFGRTQHGNNNAYAQDNPTSWLDWEHADDELITFVASLSALRHQLPLLSAGTFLTGKGDSPDAVWLKPDATAIADQEWAGLDAFCLLLNGSGESLLIAFNRSRETVPLTLPAGQWERLFTSDGGSVAMLPARSVALWRKA